ncbi:DNA repair protein RAD5 [Cercospora beticola]|uniref:DNA repair protein RAD5 n=1 Tax=Cercospora beticola TaxID=122368 RepID=A0A2G5H8V9_CERBT|nr:DNA repair protein RAD5 [Cercospora beticola]PIA88970.1 DNA repair protein RAD5 [Cercospora beticola]WPB03177.1 hypothetical protein RHO25_007814 [Cercospora beticola]
MASGTPDPMATGDSDRAASPPSAQEQNSFMEPDAFGDGDFEFEGLGSALDELQQYAQFPDDEEVIAAEQNGQEIDTVKSETGDSDPVAPFDSFDTEDPQLQTTFADLDFDNEMTEAGDANAGVSPPNRESERPAEAPRQLDFGNSILGKQKQKQRELAQRHCRGADSPAEGSPEPVISRHDSMEAMGSMPPPPAPRLNDADMEAEYQTAKANYDRKSKAGTLTTAEEIDFMKTSAHRDARQRKIDMDRRADEDMSPEPDNESGLFVSDTTDHFVPYSMESSDDEDDLAFRAATRTRSGGKRKATVEDADDDDTTTTMSAAQNAKKPRKKSGRQTFTDVDIDAVLNKADERRKDKAKKGKGAGKPAGKGSGRGKKQADLTNVKSMFGTNVFKDTEKNANLHNQPNFSGTKRKADALKQLIASVPQENRKIAAADKRFLDEACKSFNGTGAVKASPDGNWLVKGMRSTLKHYQVLGTAFMRKRENELHEPRGGILADEMGLGKTVMMLANIINGKSSNPQQKCTLIVASPALCNQWEAEIQKHTLSKNNDRHVEHAIKHGIKVVVQHRAGHRISSNADIVRERIVEADICLTTYGEICKSYPKPQVPAHLVTAAQKDAWWKDHYEKEKGVFHRLKFHRVVLDEAQAIKNHKGHTSLACRAVQATHYWAITGTPIMNRLTEFYPYFKFLREPNTGSFRIFKENFCTPDDPDGTARLAVFLRKIMIRRTHLDTLFGAKLVDLPQPKQTVVWLSFNETERQIYEIVRARFIQRINTISKNENGVLVQHYNHIWTMLLRLRQLCAHILLVQSTIVDLLKREDFEKLNALCRHKMTEDAGASVLIHLRHVLQKSVTDNEETVEAGAGGVGTVVPASQTAPINIVEYADSLGLAGRKHGLSYNFGKYMQNLADSSSFEEIEARSTCSACRQPPENPHVTSCFHIYCLTCVNELQHQAARAGRECATCVECGTEYTTVDPCALNPTYPQSSVASSASDVQSFTGSGKGAKGRGKKRKDENDWIGMKGDILPSTKTIACKAQILEWLGKDPRCKIIVYTQFMPIIRIMTKVCLQEQWNHVIYQGSMSQDARDAAIKRFGENVECNVMLMSLRCGGLGLNLTMAQHVILIDPWWNSAVEQQAFCRVFRIGQEKETRMTRFVVENTIDAAMMALKEKKEKEIDEVMENPRLKEKLTVEELLRMFGEVRHDEGGQPFIFAEGVENEEDHDRFREEDDENEEFIVNEF